MWFSNISAILIFVGSRACAANHYVIAEKCGKAIFKRGNGEPGKRGIGETGKRGNGESGYRGIGETGKRGNGESRNRGNGESGKRFF